VGYTEITRKLKYNIYKSVQYYSVIVIISSFTQTAIMTSESYYTPIAFDAKSNIVDHYNVTYETYNSDLFVIYEHYFDKWYDIIHNSIPAENYTTTTNADDCKKYYTYVYFGKYYCVNIVITDVEDKGQVYNVKITADSIKPEEVSSREAVAIQELGTTVGIDSFSGETPSSFRMEKAREYKSITDCISTCRDLIVDMNAHVNYNYLEELHADCNIEYASDHMR